MCFLDISTLFSGARGSFLALSAAGHPGGPPVHHGASLGHGFGSVARALGVQSRDTWQAIAGLLSAELDPSKAMENPTYVSCF